MTIEKGDKVAISSMGMIVTGTVEYAENYGIDGWQIEISTANVPGGYSCWKQRLDGGRIISVNGKVQA